jgi:tetratricopeptide (TPR) repeat protein
MELNADELAQLGLAAHHARDFDLAETRYRQCLSLAPKYADVMLMLAVLHMDMLDFDEARVLLETAGEIAGWRHPLYRQNYGVLLSAYIPYELPDENPGSAPPEQQSLSTLKRTLRSGGGASLSSAQLATIATRIRAGTPAAMREKAALSNDGLDVIGYARAESGLGENMRALARSCEAAELLCCAAALLTSIRREH